MIKKQAYETIISLANGLGMSKEDVNECYDDILNKLKFEIDEPKYYRIRFKNGLYAQLQQARDKEVDVYSANRKDGTLLEYEQSVRLLQGIINGVDCFGFSYCLYGKLDVDNLELDK